MTDRPWFRARESGLGWTPITWQGWLVTASSAAIAIAANLAAVAYITAAHR
jgi:hypothetical protein